MLNLNNLSIFAFLVFLLSACNTEKQHHGEHSHLIKSNYGHLKTINKGHLTPAFLINHDPSTTYDVCLSETMERNFPGIKEEIKASINLWGYYIGRKIDVNVITRNLPQPDGSWTLDNKHEVFKQKCPKGVELIVAEDVEKSGSIAYTHIDSQPWYDGKKWVAKSFTRILMLRTITSDGHRNNKFFTISQLTGENHSEGELLTILKRRNTKLFSPSYKSVPSMITLLHEVGHVWGLCDMYHLDRGSNCDHNHSKHRGMHGIAVETESVMYSSKSVVPFYLRDDDLDGIRALDERFRDNPKINYTNNEVPHEVPEEVNASWSELVSLNDININETHIEARIDLETNGDKELVLQYKYSDSARWQTTERYNFYDQTRFTNYLFKFKNRSYVKEAEAVRIVLLSRNIHDLPIELMRKDSANGLQVHEQKHSRLFTAKALLLLKEEIKLAAKPEVTNEDPESRDDVAEKDEKPTTLMILVEEEEKEEEKEQDKNKVQTLPPKKMEADRPGTSGDENKKQLEEKGPKSENKSLPPKTLEYDPPTDDEPKQKKSKIEIIVLDDKPETKRRITLDDIVPNAPKKEVKEEIEKEDKKSSESKEKKQIKTPTPEPTPAPKKAEEKAGKKKEEKKEGVDLIKFLKGLKK
jgi:hypothetical protein